VKCAKEHKVLDTMREVRQNGFVFRGETGDEAMSDMALTEVIRLGKPCTRLAIVTWRSGFAGPRFHPARLRRIVPHGAFARDRPLA
jgi:hypothetical protein